MMDQNIFASLISKMKGNRPLSLGVDQGSFGVRYVLFHTQTQEILEWGMCELEGGDPGKGKRRITSFLKELSKKIPSQQIASIGVNIQGNGIVLGRIRISADDKNDQNEKIRAALKNELSFPIEDAVYFCREYQASLSAQDTANKFKYFNFVAVEKNTLSSVLDPVTENFAIPPKVSIQGYALESLVHTLRLCDPGKTIGLLNMGRGITAILIYHDGKLIFQREIPLAGQDITRSILIMYRDEHAPEKMLTLDEAEKLKREIVIPDADDLLLASGQPESSENADVGGESKNQKLFQAIKGVLSAWIQDVRLTFHYFYENYDAGQIEKIYVFGGGAKLGNSVSYLNQQLGIPTEPLKFRPQDNARIAAGKDQTAFEENFFDYAAALGYALNLENEANLNTQKGPALSLSHGEFIKPVFRVAYVFIAALLVTWFIFLNIQSHSLKDVEQSLRAHGRFLERIESPYLEMLRWQAFLQKADAGAWKSSLILKAVSQRTPSNVLLTTINVDRQGHSLTLEGRVFGDPKDRAVTMADFTRSLKESHLFRQIEVPQLDPIGSGDEKGVFRITAQLTRETP